MSDLINNIRRISNADELEALIEQLLNQTQGIKDKQKILGERSVAYENASGGVSQKASSPGTVETDDPGSTNPETQNGDGGGNDDGSGEPGSTSDATKNEHDLNDILTDGLKIGDKVNVLSGMVQCGTANEAVIYLDGLDRPYDWGDAFDDYGANEDPREDNFIAGTWYRYAGVAATSSSNPFSSAAAYMPTLDANDPSNAPHSVVSVLAYDPVTDSNVEVSCTRASGGFNLSVSILRTGCTVGVDSYCPSEAPQNQDPADDLHKLRFDGGQFQTSEFENDDDIVAPWGQNIGSGGPSTVSGCTSSGETVEVSATGNGNSQVSFGNGDTYQINSSGVVTGVPT